MANAKWDKNAYFKAGNHRDIVIAPSILSANFAELGRELSRCRRARARWIHLDVMDGHFVPNLTIGPPLVRSLREAEPQLFFDTHLMIEEPMKYAGAFQEAGSDTITFHVEASNNPVRDLNRLKKMGLRAGISIKPATAVRAIRDCLPAADLVLVMTVEPGFGGQELIPKTLNKVRELDLIRRNQELDFRLQVDGGINKSTAPVVVAAGADVLVAGNAVFGGKRDIRENLAVLREAAAKNSIRKTRTSRRPRAAGKRQ